MARVNKRALRATLLAVAFLLILAAVLLAAAFSLFRRLDAGITHSIQTLEDITDEDLASGVNHYSARNWVGSRLGDSVSVRWGSLTGWRALTSLTLPEEREVVFTYEIDDPGDGFRLVLAMPDGGVLDLEEGENSVSLPAGKTRVVLAACRSGGDITLTADGGPGLNAKGDGL